MSRQTPSPARFDTVRVAAVLLLLASIALAIDTIGFIGNSVEIFRTQVEGRIAAIGEPGTKAEQTELKCLESASSILGDVADALAPLSAPDDLFDLGPLKELAKVGGLIEKSGTSDGTVLAGFGSLFDDVDEWADALSALFGTYAPALTAKETAKVQKLAQKAYDLYDLTMGYGTNGELGKATKTGLKALSVYAKATALARTYASD